MASASVVSGSTPPAPAAQAGNVVLPGDTPDIAVCGVARKSASGVISVQTLARRYDPMVGDEVVGVVQKRQGEAYRVDIGSATAAVRSSRKKIV